MVGSWQVLKTLHSKQLILTGKDKGFNLRNALYRNNCTRQTHLWYDVLGSFGVEILVDKGINKYVIHYSGRIIIVQFKNNIQQILSIRV